MLPLLLSGHFVRAVRSVVVPFFFFGCFFGLAGAVGGEGGFGGVEGVEGEAEEEGVEGAVRLLVLMLRLGEGRGLFGRERTA